MISASAAFNTENAKLVKQPVYRLEINSYARTLTNLNEGVGVDPWIAQIRPHRVSVNDLRGSSSLGDLVAEVVDAGNAITADFTSFQFEGADVVLKHGFPGMAVGDYVALFTGKVDRVESIQKNTAYAIVCKDTHRKTKKPIYTVGDDTTQPISSNNPRTIQGHPLNILKDILLTEIGLPAAEVDSTTIDAYRDDVFAGVEFRFVLTSSTEGKQFIEREIMMPLGGYSRINNLGKFTVRFFFPLPGTVTSSFTFTDQNLIVLPTPEQAELINAVKHRFDQGKSENVEQLQSSITKYGMVGTHGIDSKGMRSNLQAAIISSFVAPAIFNRYGDKNLRIQADAMWDAVLLEEGDFVKVTHPLIPDRQAGSLGVTDRLFEVLALTRDYKRGRVRLTLIDAEGVKAASGGVGVAGGVAKIAPNTVNEWPTASAQDRLDYMFVSAAGTGQQSDSTEGHVLG